jgi:hypothetical protein
MGRDINESGGRNTGKPNQKAKKAAKRLFFSVYLLESEKVLIREGHYDLEKATESVERFTDAGHTLKIKLRHDGNGYAATISQGDVAWDQAVHLSAYHTSISKALIALGLGLSKRYDDFPELKTVTDNEEYSF